MTISARKALLVLVGANILLIVLHLLAHSVAAGSDSPLVHQIASRFNMDEEISIPTWFSQSLLLSTALLFAYVALITKQVKGRFIKTWWFLAGLFLFASVDEGSSLHELATEPTQELLGITDGLFFFAWVIPGVVVLLLLCASLLRFFLHLPRESQIIFASATLCLFGAVGVEMISGAHQQATGFAGDFLYRVMNVFEEGLENSASILTIYGLLRCIADQGCEILPAIRFVK